MTATVTWDLNSSTDPRVQIVKRMTARMTNDQSGEAGRELAKTMWRDLLTQRSAGNITEHPITHLSESLL